MGGWRVIPPYVYFLEVCCGVWLCFYVFCCFVVCLLLCPFECVRAFHAVAVAVDEFEVAELVGVAAFADGYDFVDFYAHGVWRAQAVVEGFPADGAGVVDGGEAGAELFAFVSVGGAWIICHGVQPYPHK